MQELINPQWLVEETHLSSKAPLRVASLKIAQKMYHGLLTDVLELFATSRLALPAEGVCSVVEY